MTHRLNVLKSRTRRYKGEVEAWKKLHGEADNCYRLEKLLLVGMRLFDVIEAGEAELRNSLARGDDSGGMDEAEAINLLWEWWIQPCNVIENEIARIQKLSYDVDNAGEFLARCALARSRDASDLMDIAQIREALDDGETLSHADLKKSLDLDA